VREGASAETAFVLDLAATQMLRRITGVFPPRGASEDADRVIDRVVGASRNRRAGIQLSVARGLIDLGRIAEATAVIEAIAANTDEESAQLCVLRGALCERTRDLAGAISFYEQALALDGTRADAAINLISVLLESPEQAACARIAAVLSGLAPDVRAIPELRFNEAIYLRRIGDPDRARALLSSIAADHELGRLARQVLASC
jgi:tetratricopeptide (TPR) repeat protein